ncbi:MAG: hypothetical protein ACYC0V_09780 [Armatimonadota bacterium]
MDFLSHDKASAIFIDEATCAFSFVQEECGYGAPVIRDQHSGMSDDFSELRYESKSMYVTIFYAHMESELSLRIGLLGAERDLDEYWRGFDLDEALLLSGKAIKSFINAVHTRSESSLREAVDALSWIVEYDLYDALCDPKIIIRWMEIRKLRNEDECIEEILLWKREEAEDAWQQKDYAKLISIYDNLSGSLTPLEQKRVSFAKKHI